MFARIITSKVRKELNKMNFAFNGEILPLKVENDIWTLNVFKLDKTFVVRYYDFSNSKYYINKYLIMEKYGISMPKIVSYSDKFIVFEDYNDFNKYERIDKDTISDNSIRKIAMWYKTLHSHNELYETSCKEYFSLANINKIIKKYNLQYNKNLKYIYENFYNINLKLSKLNECFILNDFNLNNFVISKENGQIICCKFDSFVRGFSYFDIRKIKEIFNKENFEIFRSEYGNINEDESVIGDAVSKIIDLYLSINDDTISTETKKILDEVIGEKFEEKIKCIVEWY